MDWSHCSASRRRPVGASQQCRFALDSMPYMSYRRKGVTLLLMAAFACGAATGDVLIESNIVYAVGAIHADSGGGTRDLLLDAYRPVHADGRSGKALLLVHGGGFAAGSKTSADMVDAANYFAERGWVCFSIDYRLVSDDPPAPAWVEAFNDPLVDAAYAATVDTKRAIRWVRTQAGSYGIHRNRIAGLGHSAGAYCVLQACITDEDDFANDDGTPSPDQWSGQPGRLNAGTEVSGGIVYNQFEFDALDSPLMIWHGEADLTVPFSAALNIGGACDDYGIPYRLFALPGADHGAATWTALYKGRDIKAHAFEFFALFFDLKVNAAVTGNDVQLKWSSISNAVYQVEASSTLVSPFSNRLATVTAAVNTCTHTLPVTAAREFYRLRLRSGQISTP